MIILDFYLGAWNIVSFNSDFSGFHDNIFLDVNQCKGLEYTGEEYGENTCDYFIDKIKRR